MLRVGSALPSVLSTLVWGIAPSVTRWQPWGPDVPDVLGPWHALGSRRKGGEEGFSNEAHLTTDARILHLLPQSYWWHPVIMTMRALKFRQLDAFSLFPLGFFRILVSKLLCVADYTQPKCTGLFLSSVATSLCWELSGIVFCRCFIRVFHFQPHWEVGL